MLFLLPDTREVQRLNSRIRVHREQLHEMETRLKDLRKGKGGMVRFFPYLSAGMTYAKALFTSAGKYWLSSSGRLRATSRFLFVGGEPKSNLTVFASTNNHVLCRRKAGNEHRPPRKTAPNAFVSFLWSNTAALLLPDGLHIRRISAGNGDSLDVTSRARGDGGKPERDFQKDCQGELLAEDNALSVGSLQRKT